VTYLILKWGSFKNFIKKRLSNTWTASGNLEREYLLNASEAFNGYPWEISVKVTDPPRLADFQPAHLKRVLSGEVVFRLLFILTLKAIVCPFGKQRLIIKQFWFLLLVHASICHHHPKNNAIPFEAKT